MLLALSGMQRTGKTTLAKEYAKVHGATYIPADISGIQMAMGYDASNQSYDYETRIKIQEGLLSTLELKYAGLHEAKEVYVTDRAFLDLAYYAVSNTTPETSDDHLPWLRNYLSQCASADRQKVNTIFYVKPGIGITQDDKSAHASLMEQFKGDMIFKSLINSYYGRGNWPVQLMSTELTHRIDTMHQYLINITK